MRFRGFSFLISGSNLSQLSTVENWVKPILGLEALYFVSSNQSMKPRKQKFISLKRVRKVSKGIRGQLTGGFFSRKPPPHPPAKAFGKFLKKTPNKKFFGGPYRRGDFSKKPPGRRRQKKRERGAVEKESEKSGG
jgi:hypothetical protein